jgi:hypothetical protein
MDAIWIALIVAIPTTLAGTFTPIVLEWIKKQARLEERTMDIAALKAVADKADEAAVLLKRNTAAAVEAAADTHGQLRVIHTLVNSQMTEAMQAKLDALEGQALLMREVMTMKKAQGQKPNPEAVAALRVVDDKIAEQKAALADRLRQSKLADKVK